MRKTTVWCHNNNNNGLFDLAATAGLVTKSTYTVGQKMTQLWFVLLLQPFKIK